MVSYQQLAALAGNPKAARAVGGAMRSNPVSSADQMGSKLGTCIAGLHTTQGAKCHLSKCISEANDVARIRAWVWQLL